MTIRGWRRVGGGRIVDGELGGGSRILRSRVVVVVGVVMVLVPVMRVWIWGVPRRVGSSLTFLSGGGRVSPALGRRLVAIVGGGRR